MASTLNTTPTVARDVLMGDVVILQGAEYRVDDEPRYTVSRGLQMITWYIVNVDGKGTHGGDWDVFPETVYNVVNVDERAVIIGADDMAALIARGRQLGI